MKVDKAELPASLRLRSRRLPTTRWGRDMTDELVRRLRDENCTCRCNTELLAQGIKCDPCQAADRIESLTSALAASEAGRMAAEKDAGRYRWLRNNPSQDGYELVHVSLLNFNEDGPSDCWYEHSGKELDAAIDSTKGAGNGE